MTDLLFRLFNKYFLDNRRQLGQMMYPISYVGRTLS